MYHIVYKGYQTTTPNKPHPQKTKKATGHIE